MELGGSSKPPLHVAFIGGSNTDGRHRPFYTHAFMQWLSASFPPARGSTHISTLLGRGGAGSCGFTNVYGGFNPLYKVLTSAVVDLVVIETEYNDRPGRQHLACLEAVYRMVLQYSPGTSVMFLGMNYPWCDIPGVRPHHGTAFKGLVNDSLPDWPIAAVPECKESLKVPFQDSAAFVECSVTHTQTHTRTHTNTHIGARFDEPSAVPHVLRDATRLHVRHNFTLLARQYP